MAERCGPTRRRSSGASRPPRTRWRAATSRAAAGPAYGTAGVRAPPSSSESSTAAGPTTWAARARRPLHPPTAKPVALRSACQALCSCSEDSVPVGKPMLPSRALGVLVSTCGARLLHRHGSGVSCQTSSAQHYEVADCPAPQRVRRSSRQTCHPVHRIHQTAARILKGVPAHCITSQIPDHCERCHEPAGRVRRRATRADVIGLAGPSPVNSYDLWRDDIRVMRELGVKARPSL